MHQTRTAITLIAALALCVCMACPPAQAQNNVLYDNGPLITNVDACSGQDASRLETNLGLQVLGFNNRFETEGRVADDFTVPTGGWNIENITFFTYQTGAPTTPSPIFGLYIQIWDGHPGDNESSVVWGDLSTNRLIDSSFTNIQRDFDTSQCTNTRYIFANTVLVDRYFEPGTYWLDWLTQGSLSLGPFSPPVTIPGQTTTGNALQGNLTTEIWTPLTDNGYTQGLPFIITGPPCETDEDCDDGVFCNGIEECDNGTCSSPGDPCVGDDLLCDEDSATCVECLSDDNCTAGQVCIDGMCIYPCELFIKYREIRAAKLTKDRKWIFFITGDEGFDLFGQIDLGPITWKKVFFNSRKNRLKIIATVPAGLEPGIYPVSVGECSGEIIITGNPR